MRAIFADTHFWVALTIARDPWHEQAKALFGRLAGASIVTTEAVVYDRRRDKQYSLTDCMSMDVMRARGTSEVLTNDRHFAQEGFILLLAE